MLATQLVVLATIAIVAGARVSIQGNLATAKEQQEEQLAKTKDEAEEPTPTTRGQPPDISLEMAAKTGDVAALAQHGQDEKAEATEEPITSVPTTTTTSIATTRGQPPAISVKAAAMFGDVAALKQHFQAGFDLNAKIVDGYYTDWTAAHYAAHYGQAAVLQFLHEAGANLNVTDNRGATPALLAAELRNTEALETLAKAGADLQKAETNQGRTPAHMAARNGDVDALRVLIQAGVNLNARDYDGCAPADDAIGDEEALKLILEAGGIISLKGAAVLGDVAALAQERQAGSDLNADIGDSFHKGWTERTMPRITAKRPH